MKIKNWDKFQHFKNRRPPWVKLYRDLLDDREWHNLDGESAKTLVMLWLIASESEDGSLPDKESLAWRFRVSKSVLEQRLAKLKSWVYQDDIDLISTQHQDDTPEKSREEKSRVSKIKDFETFWKIYPKKEAKKIAEQAWLKFNPNLQDVLIALDWQTKLEQWTKGKQFIPQPATYLNQERWKDENPETVTEVRPKIEDWRRSEEGILAKGKELGVARGKDQSIKEYRATIDIHIRRGLRSEHT